MSNSLNDGQHLGRWFQACLFYFVFVFSLNGDDEGSEKSGFRDEYKKKKNFISDMLSLYDYEIFTDVR